MDAIAREIFSAALKAVDPAAAVARHCGRIRSLYRDRACSRLLVIGFGKAAAPMARAVEDGAGDIVTAGVVITKYGHGVDHGLKRVRVVEAGHPLPDENGLKGTEEILALARGADERTLVVVLVSGGGSALLVSPCEGITLPEKQETTSLLLKGGAEIGELNTVRKHISRVKGGRLAEFLYPAASISLILSDVIGDRLDVIASGPTSPDSTTYEDALRVLGEFDTSGRTPPAVLGHLEKGRSGLLPETPKGDSPVFAKVENVIVGSNVLALEAAKSAAEALGFRGEILSAEIAGEAAEAAGMLAGKAMALKRGRAGGPPVCLIAGGETTVTVTGSGKGGRNMELALAFAVETEGSAGITLLSAGTDGTDGPTDAAGAVVDGMTVVRAREKGLDPEQYLRDNDSYTFFSRAGGLLVTGPTGTNVMDIQIVVIE